jgi:fatty-acyl-CoA synthase
MIIRGGENIYPHEIEDLLATHPAVAAVAVVGLPDEVYGEQVGAFVRLRPEHNAESTELSTFCRRQLAPYKTPKVWEFVDELPLTPSGKVQKFLLRERWLARHQGTAPPSSRAAECPRRSVRRHRIEVQVGLALRRQGQKHAEPA